MCCCPAAAPWLDEFRSEMLRFPQGRHDDQVDSLSQFLAWATSHSWGGPLDSAPSSWTLAVQAA